MELLGPLLGAQHFLSVPGEQDSMMDLQLASDMTPFILLKATEKINV